MFVREFDSIYEWPPTPEVSPEPEEFVDDPEKQEEVITKKKPRAEEEEPILRKVSLFVRIYVMEV